MPLRKQLNVGYEKLNLLKLKAGCDNQDAWFLLGILLLAGAINCSMLEVHDTLFGLIQKGYKILSLSMDSPVTIW